MMIRSKKKLAITAILLPFLVTGCGNKEINEESGANIESQVGENEYSNENKKEEIKVRGRKVTYENLTLKYPSEWKRVDVGGMLLYKLDDNMGNLSLVAENSYESTLEEYVSNAKDILGKSIDLSNVNIEDKQYGKYEAKSIQYKYDFEGELVNIYQVCFVEEGKAYIFTLGSSDEMLENHKEKLEKTLENISFKK